VKSAPSTTLNSGIVSPQLKKATTARVINTSTSYCTTTDTNKNREKITGSSVKWPEKLQFNQ
jgi:hypothetical protein